MNTCRDSKESGLALSVAITDNKVQPARCIRETHRKMSRRKCIQIEWRRKRSESVGSFAYSVAWLQASAEV